MTFQSRYGIILNSNYHTLADHFMGSREFIPFSKHWEDGNKATAISIAQDWLEDQPNVSGGQHSAKKLIAALLLLPAM
jgi:hypothetical protein